ncbi:hypothetical protein Forpi1262_v011015 [Fusarium oxysporum f. sp. raphani]|uniref:Uncharacterized protein n=1 Tax=Fusarium oxysporum f. sp. raphani TaxID=96318 RepID=A0A8J5PYU1_FUSOX|nr:hypothetical protein Forpi1262_v011015 [Fusarium oxysporum f. sp. raphani]
MQSISSSKLPDGLLCVLKDLWPFLSPGYMDMDSDPASAEALQALLDYEPTYGGSSSADSPVSQTYESELFSDSDSLPELSDSQSLSESESTELDDGIELDFVPFLNLELGESFGLDALSILLAEYEIRV